MATDDEITVIITGRGAFPSLGIPPVGSKMIISAAAYSENWMKPATAADAKKIAKA